MRSKRLFALAFLLLAAASTVCGAQQNPGTAQLERQISEAMHAQQIPGLSVALMRADRMLYSKAFGSADLENAVPVTTETLFRTASIAKPITAVATMTLVESGKLDLDAPVQRYCGAFPPKQWPITTRELLSHSSGIRHYNPEEGGHEYTQHYRFMADGFAIFAKDPLLFQPGTGFQYSTYGYTVVGCAVEGASGKPFRDYVAEHVLTPAGMTHTFVDDVFEIVPHRARGYQSIGGQLKNAYLMDSSYKIPGGGYVSSSEDLVRFASALLEGKLVKAATRQLMWTPVMAGSDYGLGFSSREGGRFISHTGGQTGTSTILLMLPQLQAALAVMANMSDVKLDAVVNAVLAQWGLPTPAAQH
jgi:serine beta-lactamase-like protein LACTB, mitochondrial